MGEGLGGVSNRGFREHVGECKSGRCWVLGPTIHAARHDDLGSELLPTKPSVATFLPLLEKRKE